MRTAILIPLSAAEHGSAWVEVCSSMSNVPVAVDAKPLGRVGPLWRASLGMVIAVLVEYGLGMWTNLYAKIPAADKNSGIGHAFWRALSSPPVGLSVHVGLGIIIAIGAIQAVIGAITVRRAAPLVLTIIALLAIIGAGFSGASFVNKPQNSASMTMAILAGVAIACYAINVAVVRGIEQRARAGSDGATS